ncbi:hypothetical protein IFM89_033291 [Coptis chinensis]|uniref:Uncharacterized protein n=1 Tax=Coptis chinensis TaxID=261450 RepID=A0A835LP85_9MAGN|nr:hypothetical protein IFM89_033291 [Coptis chinensis]
MKHRGAWRDPNGEECPFPEDDRRCMSIYKGGMIGYNETYFTEWARNVLNDVKINKMEVASKRREIKHQNLMFGYPEMDYENILKVKRSADLSYFPFEQVLGKLQWSWFFKLYLPANCIDFRATVILVDMT